MKILLVSATELELKPLLQLNKKITRLNDNLMFIEIENINTYVLITGIGYHSLIYLLTKTLNQIKFDLVINAGIAGCYSKFNIGDVVNVKHEIFSDMIIEDNANTFTLFERKLIDKDSFPFKNGMLINETIINNKIINNLKEVRAVTSNTIHGNKESINRIKQMFEPDIESMEGAGFFYVCLQENIPFFQIRAISNKVEPMNKQNWDFELSIRKLNETIIDIIINYE